MKILFLLFPLILLLVQGAAGERGRGEMGESVSPQQWEFNVRLSDRVCGSDEKVTGH